MGNLRLWAVVLVFGAALGGVVRAAEIVVLSPENWDGFAPRGKEVDAIYGDYVLRNRYLVAVVAQPVSGRDANTNVREVGGSVIDLTVGGQDPELQNDQLVVFYPGGQQAFGKQAPVVPLPYRRAEIVARRGEEVVLRVLAQGGFNRPEVQVTYRIGDASPFLVVESEFDNTSDRPLSIRLMDELRVEHTFEKRVDGTTDLFWVDDRWFGQAYGVLAEGVKIKSSSGELTSTLNYLLDGKVELILSPGESARLTRRLFPARHLIGLKAIARRIRGLALGFVRLEIREAAGEPVPLAAAKIWWGQELYGWASSDNRGELLLALPPGNFRVEVSALGRGRVEKKLEVQETSLEQASRMSVTLETAPRVVVQVRDEDGGDIPCKVVFQGVDGTSDPDFGPDSGVQGVKNLYYTASGRFTQVLPPGRYRVIITHGPEYDAVYRTIEAEPAGRLELEVILRRVVQTPGWVSADFHSHSSPSGDNTASQRGRVLNHLAEHIEFAPCTEHNRLSTYAPHLKALEAEHLLATCVGIELTGTEGSVNHQNAFPLILKPRSQDYGAPLVDTDPAVQIERLALWDGGSKKLVQVNHPDIGEMFFDGDGDGRPDAGLPGMFDFIDVIEVHPHYVRAYDGDGGDILSPQPVIDTQNGPANNRVFNWLQLLNQGYRIPGVVNTDAHYNFHGTGWIRNYLRSPTDDPKEIKALDIVAAAEAGHIVMTNGPFLEVSLRPSTPAEGDETGPVAIPGDNLRLAEGSGLLRVRVQCANWLDVDRVQVLVNGRPDPDLNFTRWTYPGYFGDEVVKFDQEIPITLEKDAHLIVAAVGEHFVLGPVMGPVAGQARPAALSNPIFVDVDSAGFQPNRDTLDAPLPVKFPPR